MRVYDLEFIMTLLRSCFGPSGQNISKLRWKHFKNNLKAEGSGKEAEAEGKRKEAEAEGKRKGSGRGITH